MSPADEPGPSAASSRNWWNVREAAAQELSSDLISREASGEGWGLLGAPFYSAAISLSVSKRLIPAAGKRQGIQANTSLAHSTPEPGRTGRSRTIPSGQGKVTGLVLRACQSIYQRPRALLEDKANWTGLLPNSNPTTATLAFRESLLLSISLGVGMSDPETQMGVNTKGRQRFFRVVMSGPWRVLF